MQACPGVEEIRQRGFCMSFKALHHKIGQPDDNTLIDEINE